MNPAEYYRGLAGEEVAAFLRNRWAAAASGERWLRWRGDDRPLTIESPEDVEELASGGWRSFYGTIEVFSRLESREDVEELYPLRVVAATSFIDIDIVDESLVEKAWRHAIAMAEAIARVLCDSGVCESVYLLWSGAGVHVRIHEEALRGGHGLDPLQAAYLAAEYALRRARGRLLEIARQAQGLVKAENLVAKKRLFTAPMSLHRRLDRAAVAFRPENAGLFTLSWTIPGQAVHDPEAWRRHKPGEAAELVRVALEELGPAPERSTIAVPARLPDGRVRRTAPTGAREPGRFPVMALLQAARYYVLNGDIEKAKSFGLNRAIFYAWAKYYGPSRSAMLRLHGPAAKYGARRAGRQELRRVPGMRDEAPVSEEGWYSMGGVEQRPEDFDRHVARKFEEAGIPFEEAWRAAVEYVSRFPRSVLRDPQKFYKQVYEPVRDSFIDKVLKPGAPRVREPGWQPPRSREARPGLERPRQRSLLDWLEDG